MIETHDTNIRIVKEDNIIKQVLLITKSEIVRKGVMQESKITRECEIHQIDDLVINMYKELLGKEIMILDDVTKGIAGN